MTEILDRIGRAFDGIENVNMAGNTEPLLDAVARVTGGKQTRVPVSIYVLVALAERINSLSEVVSQNTLTRADLASYEATVAKGWENATPDTDVRADASHNFTLPDHTNEFIPATDAGPGGYDGPCGESICEVGPLERIGAGMFRCPNGHITLLPDDPMIEETR